MRLEQHHQIFIRPASARGFDGGVHFRRVVAVVIDQHRAARLAVDFRQRKLAKKIKAASGSLETFQRAQDRLVVNPLFRRHGHRRRRVQCVMASRGIERDLQDLFILTHQAKMALSPKLTVVLDANVGVVAKTVGGDLPADARQQFTDHRIVHAHHRASVERQVVQEVNKGLLQIFEVAMVGIHMVGFDVGHNRDHRLQMQERRIALIRFRNQITAMAETGMHARRFHQPAVDEGRVEPGFGVNTGHHRGGSGFAVSSGNRNPVAEAHQLRQHFRTADHRNARFVCGNDFRVICGNRAGNDHNAGIAHVFRAMVEINSGAKLRQLLGHRIRRQVGAADLVTFISQHFGNTAHTGTADADKVNVPDATHLGHYGTQFCQILCIHSLRHQLLSFGR